MLCEMMAADGARTCVGKRMIAASRRGDIASVAALLRVDTCPLKLAPGRHSCRTDTVLALLAAVDGGHVPVVEHLVRAGIVPQYYASRQRCAVIRACQTGDRAMLKCLYRVLPRCHTSPNQPHQRHTRMLAHSPTTSRIAPLATVASGALPEDAACSLLAWMVAELELDVDYVDLDEQTPVLAAIAAGRTNVWRFLILELGALVDVPKHTRTYVDVPRSAVHVALQSRHFETATDLILEFGADVGMDMDRKVANHQRALLAVLMEVGNDPAFHRFFRATHLAFGIPCIQLMLLEAMQAGHIKLMSLLLEDCGADPNYQELRVGRSPYMRKVTEDDMTGPVGIRPPRGTVWTTCSPMLYVFRELCPHMFVMMRRRVLRVLRCLLEHGANPNLFECSDHEFGRRNIDMLSRRIIRPLGVLMWVLSEPSPSADTRLMRECCLLLFEHGLDLRLPVMRSCALRSCATRRFRKEWVDESWMTCVVATCSAEAVHTLTSLTTPRVSRLDDTLLGVICQSHGDFPAMHVWATAAALVRAGACVDYNLPVRQSDTRADIQPLRAAFQADLRAERTVRARFGLVHLRVARVFHSCADANDRLWWSGRTPIKGKKNRISFDV